MSDYVPAAAFNPIAAGTLAGVGEVQRMMARVQEQRQLRSRLPLPVHISHACRPRPLQQGEEPPGLKGHSQAKEGQHRYAAATGTLPASIPSDMVVGSVEELVGELALMRQEHFELEQQNKVRCTESPANLTMVSLFRYAPQLLQFLFVSTRGAQGSSATPLTDPSQVDMFLDRHFSPPKRFPRSGAALLGG
jgi:hypothetical protein